MDISRNIITGEITRGNLGRNFRQGDWVNCLDENGNIKDEEQQYIDIYLLQEAKDSKTAQVLVNRNNWMYQPVFYVVDSVEREFKATETAGLNLIAVARNPRNIIAGTIIWLSRSITILST